MEHKKEKGEQNRGGGYKREIVDCNVRVYCVLKSMANQRIPVSTIWKVKSRPADGQSDGFASRLSAVVTPLAGS
ncbi:hypothetical protein OUZ56_004934 [Daphnia magna]|uniref:Uncharacterized protein n=1 Tax=Daphnia magna TaxID=35525 RepID=A0ABQ9YRA0_9CRUS|nr:hypothetical protein OUZ56_004934 [Daphnia magna]